MFLISCICYLLANTVTIYGFEFFATIKYNFSHNYSKCGGNLTRVSFVIKTQCKHSSTPKLRSHNGVNEILH